MFIDRELQYKPNVENPIQKFLVIKKLQSFEIIKILFIPIYGKCFDDIIEAPTHF